jgi:hypothetical protein
MLTTARNSVAATRVIELKSFSWNTSCFQNNRSQTLPLPHLFPTFLREKPSFDKGFFKAATRALWPGLTRMAKGRIAIE